MNGPSGRDLSSGFPRRRRLLTPREFSTVFKRNVRSTDRLFTVLAHRRSELATSGHARLGTAVARKACGNAVKRNRLKRVIKESFRQTCAALPSVDLVVIVKPGAGKIANPALFASLEKHWQVITKKCAR
ncbi:MAG: ribonuclease P protein component [Gammaproteobacteria bacterium]